MWWTINGHLFPDVPMYMVDEGDVVVFEIDNNSGDNHPMHLHGHHAVVLSRDGDPASGSPWWVDSLEVRSTRPTGGLSGRQPGSLDGPLPQPPHATEGLVAHLMYAGVESSYRVGGEADNHPE